MSSPDRQPRPSLSLALLVGINLLNYIDRYVLAAAEPMVRGAFFRPDDTSAKGSMGLLATAFIISYMLTAPVFGFIADRASRWKTIALGVIVWSLASGASGLAATFGMLLATRVFVGIGEAAYGPAAPTLIADLYPVSKRGAKLAWFYTAMPIGSAIGYGLGGYLAAHVSWRAAFYAVVAPGVLLGILACLMPDPKRGAADAPAPSRPRIDYRVLFTCRSYLYNVAGMTAMTFAVGGMSYWMPTYISEFRLHDPSTIDRVGLIFGIIVASAGLTATMFGGWLSDRLTPRHPGAYFGVSSVGMFLAVPAFLGVLWVPFPWAWVCLGLAVFCVFLNTGPSNTIIANVTPPPVRAGAFALSILLIHLLGDAISPPLIGYIVDRTHSPEHPGGDFNTAFLAIGGAILLSAIAWALGIRHLGADTARISTPAPAAPPAPTLPA